MKRFTGYLSLCIAALAGVLVGVVPTLLTMKGNGDYSYSKQYVMKINEKSRSVSELGNGTERGLDENQDEKGEALDYVLDTVKQRLNDTNISEYKLEKITDDTFSLTFRDNSSKYDDITSYLTYSNSLMFKDYSEKYTIGYTVNELASENTSDNSPVFVAGSARIEYDQNTKYPYVIAELANPEAFKTMIQGVNEASTDEASREIIGAEKTIKNAEKATEEEEAPKTDKNKVIYLLNNWLDGFSLKTLLENGNNFITSSNFSEYVLSYLDVSSPSSFFYDYDATLSEEDQSKQTYKFIKFGKYNKAAASDSLQVDTKYSFYTAEETNDPKKAYEKAVLFRNKFNSSYLKYDITVINQNQVLLDTNSVGAFKEHLVVAQEIKFSTVAIASLVAIVLVTLLLILNHGIAGLLPAITTLGTMIGSLAFFNFMGNEFNLGTILGLIAVSFLSLFLSMHWLHKAKTELYEGKIAKKAYQEANRNTLFNLLDFSIISAIIGVTCYLVPNPFMNSFGAILIVGTILNVIGNGIIFRGIEWFLFNSQFAQNHVRLFGADPKLIPDLSKEEKSPYFKAFEKQTPKRMFKIAGIASLVLMVAGLVGMITFQAVTGNIYNTASSEVTTKAVIQYNIKNTNSIVEGEITTLETNIKNSIADIYKDAQGKKQAFANAKVDTYYFDYQASESSAILNREYYFTVDFGGIYEVGELDSTVYYLKSTGESGNLYNILPTALKANTLRDITYRVGRTVSEFEIASLSKTYEQAQQRNNYYVFIASAIAVGIIFAYFLLRHGPSKALTALGISATALIIVPGIFSLIRGFFSSEITLGLLVIALAAFFAIDIIFTGERQKLNENKYELKELAAREVAYEHENNKNLLLIAVMFAVSIVILGSFLLSTAFTKATIIFAVVGLVIVYLMIRYLQLPIEMFFTKRFAKISEKYNNPERINKKTHRKEKVQFDDGPQEAIFVGIND